MDQNIYAMSDPHGCFDKYQRMIDEIDLQANDKLIILGDALDRGPKPISIIRDIMQRDNVELLLGNHELFACRVLPYVDSPIDEITEDFYDEEIKQKYYTWMFNGGNTSFEEFYPLGTEERKNILAFLRELPTSMEIEINEKKFFLVHAGIENYTTDEELGFLSAENFVWSSPTNFEVPFFDDPNRYLVFGHTPTFRIPDPKAETGKIFIKNNYIGIDCGAVFDKYHGGRLGCIRLNDMKEYYI